MTEYAGRQSDSLETGYNTVEISHKVCLGSTSRLSMTIQLVCYNGHEMEVEEDFAGQKAVCPICQVVMPVPRLKQEAVPKYSVVPAQRMKKKNKVSGQPVLIVDDHDDEIPVPVAHGLAMVNAGLGFHSARIILYFFFIFLASAVLAALSKEWTTYSTSQGRAQLAEDIILGTNPTPKSSLLDSALIVGGMIAIGLVFLHTVLGIAGSLLCLWVPRESKAQGFMIASMVLDLSGLGVGLLVTLAGLPPVISGPLGLVAWILFMLYLRKLAFYLNANDCADLARGIIFQGVALLFVPPLVLILFGLLSNLSGQTGLFICFSIFLVIGWIILAIRFLNVLLDFIGTLRNVIRRKLEV
jgi:hypothetical protein